MSDRKKPSNLFIFEDQLADDVPRTRTVVYAAGRELKQKHLTERLRTHHQSHLPPEGILLIAPGPQVDAMKKVASHPEFQESLPDFTRHVNTPEVKVVGVDVAGRLFDAEDGKIWDGNLQSSLERTGLRDIFDKRDGLIQAGSSFHYINPSDRHTQAFIRTGDVLMHSAEVGFIAFGLLKWWHKNVEHIFTDTASINAVAYSLIELRSRFEKNMLAPTVDSFSSYDGLSKFDFDMSATLCLISASTSGGLERELVEGDLVKKDRVATLFYCGKELKGSNILCDLTAREGGPSGIEPWPSYDKADECRFCRLGSATIRMSGDAFLPATPSVESVVLTGGDAPSWLADTLTELIGKNAIRCHANHESAGSMREIYIDLTEVLETPESPFTRRLETRLVSMVPARLERIVHLDDPSSEALARKVQEHFKVGGFDGAEPLMMSSVDARFQAPDLKLKGGAVIVVSGAACSGRELLSISQYMRQVENLGHLSYLIGMPRLSSESEWRRLKSNLTFGEQAAEYPLVAIRSCYLPDSGGAEGSPWAGEDTDLIQFSEPLPDSEEEKKALADRRAVIRGAESMGALGLSHELFLPRLMESGVPGEPLSLREKFVFWRTINREIHPKPEEKATQSEVYFTIAAVLHDLRQPGAKTGALVQHQHSRTVLAPANFARFNDGVIQASFLRAAHPGELDYSHSVKLSGEMRDLLQRYWDQRYEEEGEAFPEFLLALARGRLKLNEKDSLAIASQIEGSIDELTPLTRVLARKFREAFPAKNSVAAQPVA